MKLYYSLLLLVFSAISISCSSGRSIPEAQKDNGSEGNPKYSYLALGDSYTIGESVKESERWPVQLTKGLRERGYAMAAPKIIARTGWTTADLIAGINSELDVQRDFDLVSILIGVNNQYQNKSITEYEEELREIFRKAINHSKKMEAGVFAVSIPDYGVTPFGAAKKDEIGRDIDAFNEVFKRVAQDFNVDFYNITPISRRAADDPNLIAEDELHPSGLMYRYWVEDFILNVVEKLPKE
ncbi:MAG: lysophospholipase [Zunongwangia sp.]|uniref:SGNH/GDSL hydrolase family protein n=1 Tax=Zunongwangia profunda TaxID=398743 RepID=UPI000C58B522|nr:SGNH/GDSL hydrolase family protein [Zunongwangia profunda]MAC66238.1 lysophospholipase [Flavobacteriaceae bacterium]MAO35706.1 lysophospholipase [Zunongwangia sp.]MAS69345.1 lysophospholipase [Zunongwangia sp.]HAJ81825.1 lysophospholipase [Zunongwangia profunda]|tara:strand:+ start:363 stop:1082 length:720 start_codon:yes stop_codon:yes gene_type:complete